MSFHFSAFGDRFQRPSGTRELMDDLGALLSSPRPIRNLGGGNPAVIPQLQARYARELRELVSGDAAEDAIARYDDPLGYRPFRRRLAAMLRDRYGWPVGEENVATTAGSQASFFMLFNMFGGGTANGDARHVLLPLTPEYIGYADLGIEPGLLSARRPVIELEEGHRFKYRVDFDSLAIAPDCAAVCVSRPTNPTGNVLADAEVDRLIDLTAAARVPLIIDNAYGLPFPGIVFAPATPRWAGHVILCMSLSKLGLPGLRTGIVVAAPEVIQTIGSMNASLMLSTSPLGGMLAERLLADGDLENVARDIIRPFYARRAEQAVTWCHEAFAGLDYRIHRCEGAIFLWLWFPGLPGGSANLYRRLKARDTLVLSGHHFFPGLEARDWSHCDECLRVSYAQSESSVREGLQIIGEEVRRAFAGERRVPR